MAFQAYYYKASASYVFWKSYFSMWQTLAVAKYSKSYPFNITRILQEYSQIYNQMFICI